MTDDEECTLSEVISGLTEPWWITNLNPVPLYSFIITSHTGTKPRALGYALVHSQSLWSQYTQSLPNLDLSQRFRIEKPLENFPGSSLKTRQEKPSSPFNNASSTTAVVHFPFLQADPAQGAKLTSFCSGGFGVGFFLALL